MAVYRKKLVDKDGNTIIPAIGDVYGPVYTAYLLTASGGVATYKFDPDTSIEANRVYAVKFPEPTVNNAVILLTDGNITSSSILLPPVAASDSPSYEIAYTTNINDTEVWLLMYNGSGQWICLNQKRPANSADINWSDMVVVAPKVSSGTTMTLTIPAGTWKITGSMFFLMNQTSSTYQNVGLVIGTDDRRQNTNFLVYSNAIRGQFCAVDTATVTESTTVTLYGAGTLRYDSCALIAERIG